MSKQQSLYICVYIYIYYFFVFIGRGSVEYEYCFRGSSAEKRFRNIGLHERNSSIICSLLARFPFPWSRVLEKLIVPQVVRKFPKFYETRRFITVFTTVRHLNLFRGRSIPSAT